MEGGRGVVDVAVLGAGLAGMTAAHELRDLDVVVLEADDRVGGRTLSPTIGVGWYNAGAQFVWDARTLALCRELGLEVRSAAGATYAIWIAGRLVRAGNPYALLLKMPLGVRDRVDLARTILRLRRLAELMPRLDRERMDAVSLAELVGRVSPVTYQILDTVTANGVGLPMRDASAWIGLGYAIHLFGADVNDTLKGVVGGTQAICLAVQRQLGSDRVVLGARVESVAAEEGGVRVRYRRAGGVKELRARAAVVALPAPAVLEVVEGLSAAKRAALSRVVPLSHGISVAWIVKARRRVPWTGLLAVPAIGSGSFQMLSNASFFYPPGLVDGLSVLVTLTIGGEADGELWEMEDDKIRSLQLVQLVRMFPEAESELRSADSVVTRWDALPRFRPGWLRDQAALRQPLGRIQFAGDYTAQPGTPGAVGSGFHAARAARAALASG